MPNYDGALVFDIYTALKMNQRELAQFLGISLRTSQRIAVGQAHLSPDNFAQIARAVHPANPELADRIASRIGKTLEALGLQGTQPPDAAPPPAPDPRVVDSLVCVAADALELTPRAVRPVLLAVFHTARDIGLTVEMIADALEAAERKRAAEG